jgi:HD-like signal output (HDOD) protein
VCETRIFGLNHAELAGGLLGLWALPGAVVEAIALHHTPGRSADRHFTALAAVHAADVLVHEHDHAGHDIPPPECDARFLEGAHVLSRWETWRTAVEGIIAAQA